MKWGRETCLIKYGEVAFLSLLRIKHKKVTHFYLALLNCCSKNHAVILSGNPNGPTQRDHRQIKTEAF